MHGQNINLAVTLSVNSPTGQTPQQIFTDDSLKDVDLHKDVPFWGTRWRIITFRGPQSLKTPFLGRLNRHFKPNRWKIPIAIWSQNGQTHGQTRKRHAYQLYGRDIKLNKLRLRTINYMPTCILIFWIEHTCLFYDHTVDHLHQICVSDWHEILTGICDQQRGPRGLSHMVVKRKMADGRHLKIVIWPYLSQKIIIFRWNFVNSSRFWTGWTSGDQKWQSYIGQTPSSTECTFCF